MNSETARQRLAVTCALVAVVILTAHAPVCPGADGSCGGAVLSTMLRELATVDAIAVIWFQVFDRL